MSPLPITAGVPVETADALMADFPPAYLAGRDHVARAVAALEPVPPRVVALETLGRYLEATERFEAAWWLGVVDELGQVDRDEDATILTGGTVVGPEGAQTFARVFAIPDAAPELVKAWVSALRDWAEVTSPDRIAQWAT